jgi:hypothetical protein
MNRRGFVFCLCAPWALVLAACGSKSSGAPYQGSVNPGLTPGDGAAADGSEESSVGTTEADGGAGGSSGADGGSDATTACNTLVDTAPMVTTENVGSPPPVLTGGTIADGTYFLTALTVYTGDGGAAGPGGSNSTTIEVDGTTIQIAMMGANGTATEMVTTSGSSFTDTRTCPAPATRMGAYSATATTFTVQFQNGTVDGGVSTIQETFTLQQ